MLRLDDPLRMPGTGESPEQLYERSTELDTGVGREYVERRGIPLTVARDAGVRFCAEFNARPAVVVPMRGARGELLAVHARYLHATHAQDKMLTVGASGGVVSVLDGLRAEPLIVVEGLFDALSLANCGYAAIATIGRDVAWLCGALAGRRVWVAFDGGRPGEKEARRFSAGLARSAVLRLPPPTRCKDWNTALVKRGAREVERWLRTHVAASGTTPP